MTTRHTECVGLGRAEARGARSRAVESKELHVMFVAELIRVCFRRPETAVPGTVVNSSEPAGVDDQRQQESLNGGLSRTVILERLQR